MTKPSYSGRKTGGARSRVRRAPPNRKKPERSWPVWAVMRGSKLVWTSTADSRRNAILDVNPSPAERLVPATLTLAKPTRRNK